MTLHLTTLRAAWRPLRIGLMVCLWAVALPLWAADCARITNWSQADFNPAVYPTVIAVNTPGALPGSQSLTLLATSIVAVPRPSGAKTLSNNSSITVYSFTSAADAAAYYGKRQAGTVLPRVYEDAGRVAMVTTTLKQGSVTDLYLDAVYRSTVILVAGYADSSQIMASGSAVNLYMALLAQVQGLVDAKCGPVLQPNRAPTIALAPDPAAIPAFQELMTRQLEFEIKVDDADGVGEIDLGSFRVWVAGVDETRHFLETVAAHPSRMRQVGTATGTTYFFRPDSRSLMTDFNYFNIERNGKWPVSIGICDIHGACGRADYSIYFGPYLAITPSTWLGLPGGGCVGGNQEVQVSYILGNNGFLGRSIKLYVGLRRQDDDAWWTYGEYFSAVDLKWHFRHLAPAWKVDLLGSAVRINADQALKLASAPGHQPISAGEYRLLTAAVEADAPEMTIASRTAVICPH